jgi:hypothetical protein
MPKRKRSSPEDLSFKIFHARKLLTKGLKTAKAFEQRKLLRRENAAEVILLKAVDLQGLAEHHINKKLKIKSDFATNDTTARLLNTKPVKETMKRVSALLGLEVSKDRVLQSAAVSTTKSAETIPIEAGQDSLLESPKGNVSPLFNTEDILRLNAESDLEVDSEVDSKVGSEVGSEVDSNSTSESGIALPKPFPERAISKESSQRKKVSESQQQDTTFLPSLIMGGYWSGSESAEDIEEAPRKNRRGQRARRQIWEQKFGAKANHLKNQKTQRTSHLGEFKATRRPVETQNKVEDKPIHPSWEAAKRSKEQKQAQFQGKKMVFD